MQSKDLVQLAEQFGSPLYVYDAEKIQSQYNRLTKAFSKVDKLRINYAMKALSNVAILQLLKEMGAGLDTVSIQEVTSIPSNPKELKIALCKSSKVSSSSIAMSLKISSSASRITLNL